MKKTSIAILFFGALSATSFAQSVETESVFTDPKGEQWTGQGQYERQGAGQWQGQRNVTGPQGRSYEVERQTTRTAPGQYQVEKTITGPRGNQRNVNRTIRR